MRIHITCWILLGFAIFADAQSEFVVGDPDVAFSEARALAFDQQRPRAIEVLVAVLDLYPGYNDVREFLGSCYSWDGAYDLAELAFLRVLEVDPNRKSTWLAFLKNEMWAGELVSAREYMDRALKYFPEDVDLLVLKASMELKGKNPAESLNTLKQAESIANEDPKVLALQEYLYKHLRFNTIGIKASTEIYSDVFDPMQLYALKYGRQTKYGSLIARANYSRRFASEGLQFEMDAYPRISEGLYAYANLGFSSSFLFPRMRYGGELYKSLSHGLEASLGFRALNYKSGTTLIYTGSIGLYTGNYYFYVRPYLIPNDVGLSKSGSVNIRKYGKDAYNYWSASFGLGFSPLVDRFAMGSLDESIISLGSQSMSIGYYRTTRSSKHAYGISVQGTHQEISFDPGNYLWIYSVSLSWDLRFR